MVIWTAVSILIHSAREALSLKAGGKARVRHWPLVERSEPTTYSLHESGNPTLFRIENGRANILQASFQLCL